MLRYSIWQRVSGRQHGGWARGESGSVSIEWINNLKERKSAKVGVSRADLPDPVLAHENRSVRIVEQVAGDVRQFGQDLGGDVSMPLSRDENSQSRRSQQRV